MNGPTGSDVTDSSLSVGDEAAPSPIGWVRAALTSLAILAVGTALLIYLPNWVLNHLTGLERNGRVAVATTCFFVVFFAFAWVLRRLQARRVI
jgi:hypothetical protein